MELVKKGQVSGAIALAMRNEMGEWEPQVYTDHLIIESDHVLIAADTHIPKHDEKLVADMIEQAYQEGITDIVWAGDLMDMEEWSSYGIDDHSSTFQRNLRITGALLRAASELGFHQYWTLGNHEQRVSRNTRQQINMEQIAMMAGLSDLMESGMLLVSDNPSVYLPRGNWLVTHPASYGSYPTVVASKLATRNQANVIAAHEHHWGMTTDETGRFIAISSGGLYDPVRHKYINHQVTPHRAWQRGFVTVHDGRAQLYRGAPTPMIQDRYESAAKAGKEFARVTQ